MTQRQLKCYINGYGQDRSLRLISLKSLVKQNIVKWYISTLNGPKRCKAYFYKTLTPNESFPVGKVDMLTLYPMSFYEFLLAMGEENRLAKILSEK